MKKIKVLHRQSFFDISIVCTGSVENTFEIAFANNRAVTENIEPETIIIIPETLLRDINVINYYTSRKIKPATALGIEKAQPAGIGFWTIQKNFKVS